MNKRVALAIVVVLGVVAALVAWPRHQALAPAVTKPAKVATPP